MSLARWAGVRQRAGNCWRTTRGHLGLALQVVEALQPTSRSKVAERSSRWRSSVLRLVVGVLGVGLGDDGVLELCLCALPALPRFGAGLLESGQLSARFFEGCGVLEQFGGGGVPLGGLARVLQLAVKEGLVAHQAGHLFVELGQAGFDGLAAASDGGGAELVLARIDPDRAAAAVVAVVGLGGDPLAAGLDAGLGAGDAVDVGQLAQQPARCGR